MSSCKSSLEIATKYPWGESQTDVSKTVCLKMCWRWIWNTKLKINQWMTFSFVISIFSSTFSYIFFLSFISSWIVFVNFLLKVWCLWKCWLYIFLVLLSMYLYLIFFFNIKIYQLLNEVEQDEDDGGMAGETFTDYVS